MKFKPSVTTVVVAVMVLLPSAYYLVAEVRERQEHRRKWAAYHEQLGKLSKQQFDAYAKADLMICYRGNPANLVFRDSRIYKDVEISEAEALSILKSAPYAGRSVFILYSGVPAASVEEFESRWKKMLTAADLPEPEFLSVADNAIGFM